jgi:shikimate kinase
MGTSITWPTAASASADVTGEGAALAMESTETPGAFETPWKRVVLVGFMGSGKTTVGRLLAARLGWTFVDLDDEVEAATGTKVAELFRTKGEEEFRRLEAEAGAAALARDRIVIAPGGGWSLAPGRLDALPEGSLTVWLKVTPETAVSRATRHGRVRPLLLGPDPLGRAKTLLAERESVYARATLQIDAERGSATSVAQAIATHMETAQ